MPELFCADGHLHEDALRALVDGGPLSELDRLEIGEHLAYCDVCLEKYTQLLSDTALETPQHSCQDTIWMRLRLRAIRFFSQRYATAAAAVILSLGVVWGSGHPAFVKAAEALVPPELPDAPAWQDQWEGAAEQAATHLSALLDRIDPLQPDPTRFTP